MSKPLVTVIVPVYNTENYLRHCLDALVSQTLDDIRIICVNDGSTDSSASILEEYAENDNRVMVINKPNSGYGASMNVGFGAAETEYVGIVEPDDFPSDNMFEKLLDLAQRTGADVVKSNYLEHVEGRAPEDDCLVENLDHDLPDKVAFSPMDQHSVLWASAAIWSGLYRRDYIVNEGLRFLETPGASFQDTSFNLTSLMGAKKVALSKEGYLHYRTDNSASSVKAGDKVFYICDEYERVWGFLEKKPNLYDAFAKDVVAIQFKGYCWNQWRLARRFREQFFNRFFEEFRKFDAEGLIVRELYSEQEWMDVRQLLDDPNTFFMRVCGARGINKTVIATIGCDVSVDEFNEFALLCSQDEEIIVAFSNGSSFDIWPIAARDYRIKVLSEMCPSGKLEAADIRGDSLRRVALKHSVEQRHTLISKIRSMLRR